MLATLGANIYNRESAYSLSCALVIDMVVLAPAAISDIKRDLHASDAEIALSLSIFIIVQGGSPIFWSAVSEIKGRKVRHRVPSSTNADLSSNF